MEKHDRVSGLLWFALGIAMCIGSVKLNLGNFHNPGPGFMPFLSGSMLGLFGGILMFSTIAEKLRKKEMEVKKFCGKAEKKIFFFTLFGLFAYIMLLKPLGFVITSFIILFFLYKITAPKRWIEPLVLAVVTTTLSYLIFSVWLKCQFPRGIFKI